MATLNVELKIYNDHTWGKKKYTAFLVGNFTSTKISKEETMKALRQVVQFIEEWNDGNK